MQPHFFPWPGYFNLISKVEKFVFLDDVQYSKNSWQSRNQILVNKKKNLLILPIKKSPLDTNIDKKIIDFSKNWQAKHKKKILENYSKCNYYKDLEELISFAYQTKILNLAEYNISVIKFICSKFNFKTHFVNSSKLNIDGKRTSKLIKILEKIGATEYISTTGTREYLKDDEFEKITNVKLIFNNFMNKPYKQINTEEFVSNLSIIDMIANLGWIETSSLVKIDYNG